MTRTHYTIAEVAAMTGCTPRTATARARRVGVLVDLSCGAARPSLAVRVDDLARMESSPQRTAATIPVRSNLSPRDAALAAWNI